VKTQLIFKSLLIFLLGAAATVRADSAWGIKGGLNLAARYGDTNKNAYDNRKLLPGAAACAFLELAFSDNFALQPELAYTMKGYKSSTNADNSTVSRFHFIEIPVLFKLRVQSGSVTTGFYAGPALAFRAGISGYAVAAGDKTEFSNAMINDMKDMTKVVDFGVPLGVDMNIDLGSLELVLDARYTLGLVKIWKLTDDMKDMGMTEDDLTKDKNQALSIMAGLAFSF